MEPHIFIRVGSEYIRIILDDLIFVVAVDKTTSFTHLRGTCTSKVSLQAVEDKLPNDEFFRVNDSTIISAKQILSFDTGKVTMIGGKVLTIDEKYQYRFDPGNNLLITPLLQ